MNYFTPVDISEHVEDTSILVEYNRVVVTYNDRHHLLHQALRDIPLSEIIKFYDDEEIDMVIENRGWKRG